MKRDMPQVSAEAPMTDPNGFPKQIMLNQKDDARMLSDSGEPETRGRDNGLVPIFDSRHAVRGPLRRPRGAGVLRAAEKHLGDGVGRCFEKSGRRGAGLRREANDLA